MNQEEARICIEHWKNVHKRMVSLAAKKSTLPSPDYIEVGGWKNLENGMVRFGFHAACGASDREEGGVVLCHLSEFEEGEE